MRLALFAFVNVVVAGFFGFQAYAQGKTFGQIAMSVVLVLVVLQLAYVVWLVALSVLKRKDTPTEDQGAETFVTGSTTGLRNAESIPGSRTR